MHMDFITSCANLRAENFGIKQNRDTTVIAQTVAGVTVPAFSPKSGVKIATTEAEAGAADNGICGKCTNLPIGFSSLISIPFQLYLIMTHFSTLTSKLINDWILTPRLCSTYYGAILISTEYNLFFHCK